MTENAQTMRKAILLALTVLVLNSCDKNENMNAEKIEGEAVNIDFKDFELTRSFFDAEKMYNADSNWLILNSGEKTDYFNEPDGKTKYANGQLLLKEIDNTQPFTFSIKVEPAHQDVYDAGTLFIYEDNDHWQKFAFEVDEQKNKRIVTVRTIETSDDNNHEIINQPYVYMKISSDSEKIGFYYSLDNITWSLVRLYANDFKDTVLLGIGSQSPIGKGIKVKFTDPVFTLNPITNFRAGI